MDVPGCNRLSRMNNRWHLYPCRAGFSMLMVLVTLSAYADDKDSCLQKKIRCVGPNEEYNTQKYSPQNALQMAADDARPGDTIKIRGGIYRHQPSKKKSSTLLHLHRSGESAKPITVKPFNDDKVVFEGAGFNEKAAKPRYENEVLVQVTGDYIKVSGLTLKKSSRHGLLIQGSYGYFENLKVHDNWRENIALRNQDKAMIGNTLRHIETFRSRHGSGIWISPDQYKIIKTNIEYSLSHHNGYLPGGNKVPPVPGDLAGGGNSDGIQTFKTCHKIGDNQCPETVIKYSIVWNNADDGFDISAGGRSRIINNIAFNNGPEGNKGYKIYSQKNSQSIYMGNIALGQPSFGFEMRFNHDAWLYHNASMNNQAIGMAVVVQEPQAGKTLAANNISMGNVGDTDFRFKAGGPGVILNKTNWAEESSNNKSQQVVNNKQFTIASVKTECPETCSIEEKVNYIRSQFVHAFSPQPHSPLIDAGTFIKGIHCPWPIEKTPVNATDKLNSCRQWSGKAPDIGVVEYIPPNVASTMEYNADNPSITTKNNK